MTHKLSGSEGENSASANASPVENKHKQDTPISNTPERNCDCGHSKRLHVVSPERECMKCTCASYVDSVLVQTKLRANAELHSELAHPHPSNTEQLDDLIEILDEMHRQQGYGRSKEYYLGETVQKLLKWRATHTAEAVRASIQAALDAGYAGDDMGTYDYDRIAEYCFEKLKDQGGKS